MMCKDAVHLLGGVESIPKYVLVSIIAGVGTELIAQISHLQQPRRAAAQGDHIEP